MQKEKCEKLMMQPICKECKGYWCNDPKTARTTTTSTTTTTTTTSTTTTTTTKTTTATPTITSSTVEEDQTSTDEEEETHDNNGNGATIIQFGSVIVSIVVMFWMAKIVDPAVGLGYVKSNDLGPINFQRHKTVLLCEIL